MWQCRSEGVPEPLNEGENRNLDDLLQLDWTALKKVGENYIWQRKE
jgi:hypothetical protein